MALLTEVVGTGEGDFTTELSGDFGLKDPDVGLLVVELALRSG